MAVLKRFSKNYFFNEYVHIDCPQTVQRLDALRCLKENKTFHNFSPYKAFRNSLR